MTAEEKLKDKEHICDECNGSGKLLRFLDRTFSNRCPRCNGYGEIKDRPNS